MKIDVTEREDMDESRWALVYSLVVVNSLLVFAALWWFTFTFS